MNIVIDKELFQWEKERYVYLELADGEPVPDYIQFYNKNSSLGPEVAIFQNKAKIPNYLLTEHFPIMALACIGETGATQVLTRREFKVIKRVRPENYKEESSDDFISVIYDGGMES